MLRTGQRWMALPLLAAALAALLVAAGLWTAGGRPVHAATAPAATAQDAAAAQEQPEGQEQADEDRDMVMLGTAAAAGTLLVVLLLAYGFRKAYGIQIVPGPEEEQGHGGGGH